MSQLANSQLPSVSTSFRTMLVAASVALVLAALALTFAISTSDGDSGASQVKPGEAPALRSDGGPEESMRGPIAGPRPAVSGPALRPDGGPEESTRLR